MYIPPDSVGGNLFETDNICFLHISQEYPHTI